MVRGEQSIGYQCLACGAKFGSSSDLIDHMREYNRSADCPKRLISLFVKDTGAVGADRGQFSVHRKDLIRSDSPRFSRSTNSQVK